jgi:Domain of unknown function (DUF1772)
MVMFTVLQVVSVFLVAVAMAMAMAHALELPGKVRLDKSTYNAMQSIYYPGFTTAGGFGEGGGIIATAALLLLISSQGGAFWWTLTALVALVAMHVVYWVFTHPVNKFWVRDQELGRFGKGFFAIDPARRPAAAGAEEDDWKRLRNRWEYSHVLRALLAAISLTSLVTAVAM